MKIGQGV